MDADYCQFVTALLPAMPAACTDTCTRPCFAEPGTGAADTAAEDGPSGRKRRSAEPSSTATTPARESSPKLAAALVDGQLFKAPPARAAGAHASTSGQAVHGSGGQAMVHGSSMQAVHCSSSQAAHGSHMQGIRPASGVVTTAPVAAAMQANASGGDEDRDMDSDDSVPLVSSKLAARLAVDKCTPVAARHSNLGSQEEHAQGELLAQQACLTSSRTATAPAPAPDQATGRCVELSTWAAMSGLFCSQIAPSTRHSNLTIVALSTWATILGLC